MIAHIVVLAIILAIAYALDKANGSPALTWLKSKFAK